MKKILVAEDDEFLRNAYRVKLMKEGFDVRLATDGREAIILIQSFHPDLLILDLMMPIFDGFTVLQKIKTIPEVANIPVIVASNLGQNEDIEKAKQLGATDFVIKSDLHIKDLIVKIKQIIPEPE